MRIPLSAAWLVAFLPVASASGSDVGTPAAGDPSVFHLGEFEVRADRELPVDARSDVLGAASIQSFKRQNLSSALNLLPGVTLNSVSGRNELGVHIRGFDLRQTPLFIDGIPVYVPYDGYVDLGRFSTFDVGLISVAKGFSTVVSGPNALGGSINVVSRRPQESLELDSTIGMFSGNGRRFSTNIGAKRDAWYAQVGASYVEQDYYRLSGGFVPTQSSEDGGRRENSYRKDRKLSMKVGYTPNDTDEYALGISRQEAEKGTPPYTGFDPAIRPRFWRWPQWDKTSVYFIGNTALGADGYIKPRLYFDTFENQLFAYDDATYTTQNRGSSFRSIYDDYTYGGSVEFGTNALERHTIKAAAHYKFDVHREHNVGDPETHFRDRTWALAVEDTFRFNDEWSFVGGVSYEGRQSAQAQNLVGPALEDFPGNRDDAFNPQLGVFYALSPTMTLEASIARKSRFPTVKDRYSYRLGQAIPNPDLEAEHALHYEIAWRGQPGERLTMRASVFLSRIDDTIQRVDRVALSDDGDPLFQLRNVGKSEHRGIELAGSYTFSERLNIGASYTWLERENLTDPLVRPTDTPEHKALAFVEAKPLAALTLLGSVEYNSSRFSTSYGVEAGGFTLVNLKANYDLPRGISLSAGVNNLFDRNYQLTEGFPEEGRSFFTSLSHRF